MPGTNGIGELSRDEWGFIDPERLRVLSIHSGMGRFGGLSMGTKRDLQTTNEGNAG